MHFRKKWPEHNESYSVNPALTWNNINMMTCNKVLSKIVLFNAIVASEATEF